MQNNVFSHKFKMPSIKLQQAYPLRNWKQIPSHPANGFSNPPTASERLPPIMLAQVQEWYHRDRPLSTHTYLSDREEHMFSSNNKLIQHENMGKMRNNLMLNKNPSVSHSKIEMYTNIILTYKLKVGYTSTQTNHKRCVLRSERSRNAFKLNKR